MRINADLDRRAVVRPGDVAWTPSPMHGVERQMLDRVGDEVARATSIVRYAPNSRFSEHAHGGGEELFVLDGVFSDADADYPAGSYVRNPIGSAHAPHSEPGCIMLVKLHQFDPADMQRVMIDTHRAAWQQGMVPGLKVMPLHQHGTENVALVKWAPDTHFNRHRHWGGEEILVIDGTFQDEHGDYPAGSWLRNPHRSEHTPFSNDGCTIYVKTGHLARDSACDCGAALALSDRVRAPDRTICPS